MPLLHILILALVQGITEFLPISSSAHLVLTWEIFDQVGAAGVPQQAAQRLVLDVAVHVGTLFAVLAYFHRDVALLVGDSLRWATGRAPKLGRLVPALIVATVPVIVAGFLAKDLVAEVLRSTEIIALTTLIFAVLLYLADRYAVRLRRVETITLAQALLVGLSQILALIPGTSRAGVTMTAARALGFERTEAARFSLLLAIPTIAGAGVLAGKDVLDAGNVALGLDALIAAALAFFSALVAIWAMIGWLKRASFTPFVVYRLILGAVLLAVVYA